MRAILIGIVLVSISVYSQHAHRAMVINNSSLSTKPIVANAVESFPDRVGVEKTFGGTITSSSAVISNPKSYFTNKFEIKAGYEFIRKLPEGIVGYNWRIREVVSIVPEAGFLMGITAALSFRVRFPMVYKIDLYAQAGAGFSFMSANALITAAGTEFNIAKGVRLQAELRVLFYENNVDNRDVAIQGYNILKYKPVIFMMGISL
ncbi:MAG: hypothetical protein HYV28_16890 [Ignavibacteriales bacterium]|nr:hypothetical protein [Ignavibacteriales bacterium]